MSIYSSTYDDVSQRFIGRKVESVEAVGNDRVHLTLGDGQVATLRLEDDCCSQSYFTDTAQFDELRGATIQGVEERDGPEVRDYGNVECVRWHFLVFVTDRGHVTIDWRNDSNGYYDGRCFATFEEGTP